MSKVYIVTSGCYSNYGIEAVFSTKGRAEEFISVSERFGANIEEYDLDTPREDYVFTMVAMDKEGNASEVVRYAGDTSTDGFNYYRQPFGASRENAKLVWYVKTEDKEKAIKVANEKRVAILAMGIWGNNKMTKELIK